MEFSALASGSSGNCFFIENNSSGILIDTGISAKQIIERLKSIGKNPNNIRALFLTHEHLDHIKGCRVFSKKFNVPVFGTFGTLEKFDFNKNEKFNIIKNNETIRISGMEISAFSKSHKAKDPVSYTVSNGKKISIITDVGYPCNNVISNIQDSDALCIESNYDLNMLENGNYPYFLKNWIKSDIGHLSNNDSANCVFENSKPRLKNIILSHLSENNNTPECAMNAFSILRKKNFFPNILVSTRNLPTPLLKV